MTRFVLSKENELRSVTEFYDTLSDALLEAVGCGYPYWDILKVSNDGIIPCAIFGIRPKRVVKKLFIPAPVREASVNYKLEFEPMGPEDYKHFTKKGKNNE